MEKSKATYQDAATHFYNGRTVVLSSTDDNVHLTFNPNEVDEEYLEDVRFDNLTTDQLSGQWYVIEDEKDEENEKN